MNGLIQWLKSKFTRRPVQLRHIPREYKVFVEEDGGEERFLGYYSENHVERAQQDHAHRRVFSTGKMHFFQFRAVECDHMGVEL